MNIVIPLDYIECIKNSLFLAENIFRGDVSGFKYYHEKGLIPYYDNTRFTNLPWDEYTESLWQEYLEICTGCEVYKPKDKLDLLSNKYYGQLLDYIKDIDSLKISNFTDIDGVKKSAYILEISDNPKDHTFLSSVLDLSSRLMMGQFHILKEFNSWINLHYYNHDDFALTRISNIYGFSTSSSYGIFSEKINHDSRKLYAVISFLKFIRSNNTSDFDFAYGQLYNSKNKNIQLPTIIDIDNISSYHIEKKQDTRNVYITFKNDSFQEMFTFFKAEFNIESLHLNIFNKSQKYNIDKSNISEINIKSGQF